MKDRLIDALNCTLKDYNINGKFIIQSNYKQDPKFKVYKSFTMILWYVPSSGANINIAEVNANLRCLSGEEDKAMSIILDMLYVKIIPWIMTGFKDLLNGT